MKGPHPRLLTSISKELHNPPTSNLTCQFLCFWSQIDASTSEVHRGHYHRRVKSFWQRLWPLKLRTDHPVLCSQFIPPNATIFPAPTNTAAFAASLPIETRRPYCSWREERTFQRCSPAKFDGGGTLRLRQAVRPTFHSRFGVSQPGNPYRQLPLQLPLNRHIATRSSMPSR